jgi:histidyl-tRNA synthetase
VRPDGSARKLGRQLESAAKAGATWAVILGAGESEVVVRNLASGEQRDVTLGQAVATLVDAAGMQEA